MAVLRQNGRYISQPRRSHLEVPHPLSRLLRNFSTSIMADPVPWLALARMPGRLAQVIDAPRRRPPCFLALSTETDWAGDVGADDELIRVTCFLPAATRLTLRSSSSDV